MAATSTAINPSASDIIVTREDQAKINRFAQLNSRLDELTETSNKLKGELQTIEDLVNEIELKMLEEDDEEEGANLIDIMCGETFIKLNYSEAQKWIEAEQKSANNVLKSNIDKMEEIREEMNTLKTALYAKFGRDGINLEPVE